VRLRTLVEASLQQGALWAHLCGMKFHQGELRSHLLKRSFTKG
jgi:hypothetical protein